MTEIVLERLLSTSEFTLGMLHFGDHQWPTVEDAIRKKKIPKITCIPPGRYRLMAYQSPKFKREVPMLQDVPDFTYIEIHPANWATNVEGCIGIGKRFLSNGVADSKEAFKEFMVEFRKAIALGEVYITITNPSQIWEAS